jgi:hypothetical protein
MSTEFASPGLGRPSLTLRSETNTSAPSNAGPRVYQWERRNAFVAEFEMFKAVKANL